MFSRLKCELPFYKTTGYRKINLFFILIPARRESFFIIKERFWTSQNNRIRKFCSKTIGLTSFKRYYFKGGHYAPLSCPAWRCKKGRRRPVKTTLRERHKGC